jgi:hypothetical protein
MDLLAKEFASVPDREIPPSETHEDDQSSAMSAASKIMPKETSGSIASTNIAITKTICSALSDMRVKP